MLLIIQYVYSVLWITIFLKVLASIYAIVINKSPIHQLPLFHELLHSFIKFHIFFLSMYRSDF